MASYSRQLLSGSVNGKAIAVAATATPGTAVHTAVAGTAAFDEIYIWATNVTGAARQLTIEWGGAGAANQLTASVVLPANSPPIPIATGQVLQSGLQVAAFTDSANGVVLTGFVNRIQ